MKLSTQALGAVMMALQKSLLEQSDIVPVLLGFEFEMKDGELFVQNPPTFKLDDTEEDEEDKLEAFKE